MNKVEKELYGILSPELRWNKARLTCFIKMLMAIFAVKTINLTSIAMAFNSDAKMLSRYKRVQDQSEGRKSRCYFYSLLATCKANQVNA